MKKKTLSILLIITMAVCFTGAAYYPVKYFFQKEATKSGMEDLREMRVSALDDNADTEQADHEDDTETGAKTSTTGGSVSTEAAVGGSVSDAEQTQAPAVSDEVLQTMVPAEENVSEPDVQPEETEEPGEAGEEPIDRYMTDGTAIPYPSKEKVQLDEAKILAQYKDIYDINNDMVGWLYIPGTTIDYPVVQNEDPEYYLKRDFYGNKNSNGQLILDTSCDPWTPSYNLVVSGHNMKSGMMFAPLGNYASKGYWSRHKTFTFDTVMREGTYVVFAAFFSADYAEGEEGFRYNANIQYRLDAEVWLEDIMENREYDTGIDVEFGDEFLTLTTCLYHRDNGRFVVVARRVREGEVIE